MTDKELKDWCKTCSVEPPAMKFKCPECEHNPDKEQIIIDGVDVSECLFYQSNFEEDYNVKIKHFCSNWYNSCESSNNSNCYFKQLARKTQLSIKQSKELIRLRKELQESTVKNRNLKQECEQALNEIEEYIYTNCEYNDGCDRNICIRCDYSNVHDKRILDIINKVRGCI